MIVTCLAIDYAQPDLPLLFEWNSNGEVGNPGDKHYKCLHGNMKILTVTKKMKYSLNGELTIT